MIHRQLGKRRRVKGVASFACAALFGFLMGGPLRPASAGEFDRSTLPAAVADPAQCGGEREASGLLQDSGDCKRISGYIAAGAWAGGDWPIGGRPSPFVPLDAPKLVGGVRPSGAAIIDVPAGQDRLFPPPDPGDEAR
jgi:hypothetical protein